MFLIVPGVALAIVSLVIQMIFCYKMRKLVLKLIPIYGFLLSGVLLLLTYIGIFGKWSGDFLANGHEFVAGYLAIILGIAFIGNIAAWVIWGITVLFSRNHNQIVPKN